MLYGIWLRFCSLQHFFSTLEVVLYWGTPFLCRWMFSPAYFFTLFWIVSQSPARRKCAQSDALCFILELFLRFIFCLNTDERGIAANSRQTCNSYENFLHANWPISFSGSPVSVSAYLERFSRSVDVFLGKVEICTKSWYGKISTFNVRADRESGQSSQRVRPTEFIPLLSMADLCQKFCMKSL